MGVCQLLGQASGSAGWSPHVEQLLRPDFKIVGGSAPAQDGRCRRRLVHPINNQMLGNVHGHYFTEHQPGGDVVTILPLQLHDLCLATFKVLGTIGQTRWFHQTARHCSQARQLKFVDLRPYRGTGLVHGFG